MRRGATILAEGLTCALVMSAAIVNAQSYAVRDAQAQEEQGALAAEKVTLAESIVVRVEAASGRVFDPAYRGLVMQNLVAMPLARLESMQGQSGLGTNAYGDTQADLAYTPLTPCRIIDTRLAGGRIDAGTSRDFLVAGSDLSAQGGSATGCGVPHGPATAAVINFVAAGPTGPGNLQVTPFGSPIPTASIINYTAGVNIANGLAIAICDPSAATCTKDFTIKANVSATQLVADVQGYFRLLPFAATTGASDLCYGGCPFGACTSGLTLASGDNFYFGRTCIFPELSQFTATRNNMTCIVTAHVEVERAGVATTGAAAVLTALRNVTTGVNSKDGGALMTAATAGVQQGAASKGARWAVVKDNSYRFGCYIIAGGDFVGATAYCNATWTCQ